MNRAKFLSTSRAVPSGEASAERPDRGERVGGTGDGPRPGRLAGQALAPADVPGGEVPAVLAAEPGNLHQGVVGLEGPDPDPGEAGADVLREALGERHGSPPGFDVGRLGE